MIYLFDDKRGRQIDFGWTQPRLEKYSSIIKPIYLFKEIEEKSIREQIFSPGNTILFHESFFDNVLNRQDKTGIDIRKRLNEFASEAIDFQVAYYSGSKNSRKIDKNIGYLPVSILYQNLEVFIGKAQNADPDLKYLLFGKNYKIEEILLEKLLDANNAIEDKIQNANPLSKNFIALTLQNDIEPAFVNAVSDSFFLDEHQNNDITDEYLSDKIQEWFANTEYDNIFIPACFGPILSDYNGLRFALHLRCTESPNRLKNIFLYSFVDHSYLVGNEYFDILKTKNVNLIEYSKTAFFKAIEEPISILAPSEISGEIKKIKLDPPRNYEDSHSIVNEWAITRWAAAIDAEDEAIQQIYRNIGTNIYFKYLLAIHPRNEITIIPDEQLKFSYSGEPKVLYIDDEAEKGWYEIFCKILYDVNGLDFTCLDEELNSLTPNEIIDTALKAIKEGDIDLVILDFRLHSKDFEGIELEEVTGLKLLKAIKVFNPGIQVIVFSATNKIWNFQALNKAGADGFIVKESFDSSNNKVETVKTIVSFKGTVENALNRRFLKKYFNICKSIRTNLLKCKTEDESEFDNFIKDLISHLKIIESSGKSIDLSESFTLDIVYLNCFNFLEKFNRHYLSEINRGQFVMGVDETELMRYSFENNRLTNEGSFFRLNQNDSPSWFQCMTGLFVDYFSISATNGVEIQHLWQAKGARNSYIHGKKQSFSQVEAIMILSLCEKITSPLRE